MQIHPSKSTTRVPPGYVHQIFNRFELRFCLNSDDCEKQRRRHHDRPRALNKQKGKRLDDNVSLPLFCARFFVFSSFSLHARKQVYFITRVQDTHTSTQVVEPMGIFLKFPGLPDSQNSPFPVSRSADFPGLRGAPNSLLSTLISQVGDVHKQTPMLIKFPTFVRVSQIL